MAKRKLKKLSKPAFAWALLIALGIHHKFETPPAPGEKRKGFWIPFLSNFLVLPFLWRALAYSLVYWQQEGIYFDVNSGRIITKDFDEPEGLYDLVKIIFGIGGRQWIAEKSLPAAVVDSFKPEKLLWGWMTRVRCGSSGGASLIPVVISNPKSTEKKVKKEYLAYSVAAAEQKEKKGWKHKVTIEAKLQLDIEEEKKRLQKEKALEPKG